MCTFSNSAAKKKKKEKKKKENEEKQRKLVKTNFHFSALIAYNVATARA